MADLIHFITLQWGDDAPRLLYRSDPALPALATLDLFVDEPLVLTIQHERRCTGYYDFVARERVPCPEQRRLGSDYAQCYVCQRREVTYYTFTGYGADPAAAQHYLDTQMHQAYLALFGRDLLKVGVASEGRRLRRTLEQGATAAIFWARANGSEIRELERFVSRDMHIRERITTLQKAKRLADQIEATDAETLLRAAVDQIAERVPATMQPWLLPTTNFHVWQPLFRLRLPSESTSIRLVTTVSGGDVFAGQQRGVVGSLLLLEDVTGALHAVPLKLLSGYMIDVTHAPQAMRLQHAPRVVAFDVPPPMFELRVP